MAIQLYSAARVGWNNDDRMLYEQKGCSDCAAEPAAACSLILFAAFVSASSSSLAEDAILPPGVREEMDDVILVGADDWHESIAATPLAIWTQDNHTTCIPLLILPRANAGERNGWIEGSDLERYGSSAILDTFKSANISTITVHGRGEKVKDLVQAAHKDGLRVFITATLEIPYKQEMQGDPGEIKGSCSASHAMLQQAGLSSPSPDESGIDRGLLRWRIPISEEMQASTALPTRLPGKSSTTK